MDQFTMSISKGESFLYQINGYVEDQYEAQLHEMVAAMREGLEANGYSVKASITYANRVDL